MEPKFGTVYADPCWNYQNWTHSRNGAASSQYETMKTSDICAIPVSDMAAKDAHLFLWGTWPKLPDALRVMEAWGFEYITGFPWIKYTPSSGFLYTGIGFWSQGLSEFVFIGRRGKPKKGKTKPVKGLLCGSEASFYAPRAKHSEKPLEIQSWIERVSPGPFVELFARSERPGWTSYGLDLGWKLGPNGPEKVRPDADHHHVKNQLRFDFADGGN